MKEGIGKSYGAISVLNAIPCGIGSTIGVELLTGAYYETSESKEIIIADDPNMDTLLAETCVSRTIEKLGLEEENYKLTIKTEIPPSVGLKSSSSVCNAVVASVAEAYGEWLDPIEIVELGVRCAKECGATITGAFDDACGCKIGGLVITDNRDNKLILSKKIPEYDVVIYIPDKTIPKCTVPTDKYKALTKEYEAMVPRIENEYLDIITENGRKVSGIVGEGQAIADKALELGALAAGMSGTGPAIAIVAKKGDGERIAEEIGGKTIVTRTI